MNNILLMILFVLIAVLISVTVTIIVLKKKYDRRLSDFQDSVLRKQRDEVQNIYQTMRAWRHDYHNHIQSIKAMLSMDKREELENYLDNLEKDLDSIDIAIRTGNVGLDAILSSKVSIARKNSIEVNCTAKVPGELKITDVHLCAIVGNLMDNAIEACEKITLGENGVATRFIRIYIGLFKNQLYISITNSTNVKKRQRVTELVTSKIGEHGFGLRRIDKLVDKYDGYVNRKNEPGVFATEIMLPL
ncbi:MAG: GHKL domain-containing protein [Treponema sp.]|nr:GHKL domain-containing protein [Treponema sp.]